MKDAYSGIWLPFSSTMMVFHGVWFGDINLVRSFLSEKRSSHPLVLELTVVVKEI